MTTDPDGIPPEDPGDPARDGASGRKLDEDAAWRAIVENYGPEPADLPPAEPDPVVEPFDGAQEPPVETRWRDALDTEASWNDEGHFIPPEPPPLPRLEPRRKLAWIGMFGAPLVMLVSVVLGLNYPQWVGLLLVAGFVGGFGYLVATMPRNRPGDGSGDDGAVV